MSVNVTGFPGISPNITSLSQCTPSLCSLDYAEIRYIPTLAGNAFYLTIFAIFFVTQAVLCFFYRTYSYTFAISCGLILEIVGYAGRLGMHNNPFLSNPFLINIICLTIAPIFFTAALYLTLSRLILHYGTHNSRFFPRTYTLAFITSDIIALILQATGGGIADTAGTRAGSQTGVNIMVAGLSFQVISLVCFIVLCAEFFWNVRTDKRILKATDWAAGMTEKREEGMGMNGFIVAFTAATLLILARSIFRVAELAHGFGSRLANDQVAFMILEGGMIILATGLMTGFHPGRYFGEKWGESGWKISKKSRGEEVKISLMEDDWSNDIYLRPLPLAR